jgi:membrane peptidoglycan carboxypeptidase
VGTTPLYTGSVWVGRQQGGEMPINYYSGYVSAPIWRRMMELAHAGQPLRQFSEPPGIQYVDAPDQPFLPGVKLAVLDPRYRDAANTDLQADAPAPVQYRESGYAPGGSDPRTVMVSLDRVTNRLATEFTPPENIVERRVEIESLPAYAPDPSPTPLKDESPDPDALKAARSQGGAPQTTPAPDPEAPSPNTPAPTAPTPATP